METIIKLYRFYCSDPVTVLSFLEQFKTTSGSNEVSESVAIWHLPFFKAKAPAASLSIRLTPIKDFGTLAIVRRSIEEQKLLYTYAKIVEYFQLLSATDDVIIEAAPRIKSFKKLSNQTAV